MNSFTIIGAKGGPAISPGSFMPTSGLLQMAGKTIVIDCGLGVTAGIVRAGVKLTEFDAIFITHLHSDHYLELGPLLHTAWTAGMKKTIDIYAPLHIHAYLDHFFESMRFDINLRIDDENRPDIRNMVNVHPLSPGDIDLGGLRVRAILNDHPPLEDSYAFRFDSQEASMTYSGDTAYFEPLIDLAKGCDLLVHEAMLLPAIDALIARVDPGNEALRRHIVRSHTSAENAGKIATRAGVGKLALNHLVPSGDPNVTSQDWIDNVSQSWEGPLVVAQDNMRIAF